ncbi:MAG: gph [Verrucomicrobia bacterium]|nr:gph [Verrucomicrobiota bacterium]
MIRLVLFDIDGTLIRTKGIGGRSFGATFRTVFGQEHKPETVNFAGRTDSSLLREFFQHYQIAHNQENLDKFIEAYVFWLEHLMHDFGGHVCAGVTELIEDFKALPDRPIMGILTGNLRIGAEIKLRHHGIWEHFEFGVFADDHEDRNQLAAIAKERAGQMIGRKLKGEDILIIGDTPRDIDCARYIGAKILAVATGGHTMEELREHNPTWLVESLVGVRAGDLNA